MLSLREQIDIIERLLPFAEELESIGVKLPAQWWHPAKHGELLIRLDILREVFVRWTNSTDPEKRAVPWLTLDDLRCSSAWSSDDLDNSTTTADQMLRVLREKLGIDEEARTSAQPSHQSSVFASI